MASEDPPAAAQPGVKSDPKKAERKGQSARTDATEEPPAEYNYTVHARNRMRERKVTDEQVEAVIRIGAPKPARNGCKNAWATVDGRLIRVTSKYNVATKQTDIITVAADEEAM